MAGLSEGVISISSGYAHACALTQVGGVKCWGDNGYGELEDGTTISNLMPVDVLGLASGVISISVGDLYSCALTAVGGVKCWGKNDLGQLGDGAINDQHKPEDVIGLTSGVSSVSAGFSHTCALTQEGRPKCWGFNGNGELGDGATTGSDTPVDVIGLESRVIAASVGDIHTCVLTQAGGVKCWGFNGFGESGDGTKTGSLTPVDVVGLANGIKAISSGYAHTCALTQEGNLKCWGFNNVGQLGDGMTYDSNIPVDVVGLTGNVSSMIAGYYHSCALMQTGKVMCWGWNFYGQLGNGTKGNSLQPVEVIGFP